MSDPSTPDWREHLRSRLASLGLRPARELEIIEELSQHLDERYEELRRGGATEDDARRVALEELQESETLARQMQVLRQAHIPAAVVVGEPRFALVADLRQDLRYAARMLRQRPGFTTAITLTLALGIGANTALFSLVDATLFRRLPVTNSEALVYVYRGTGSVFSYPAYAWLSDSNRVLAGFAAWGGIVTSLNAGPEAEQVTGAIVTGNFFDVLGVVAARGRLLATSDDVTPGAHPVAVISHDLWQIRFAGQSDIIGREVHLNGQPFTIIGVTPAGFPGPQLGTTLQLYVPMMMQAIIRPPRAGYSGEQNPDLLSNRTSSWLSGVARLKPGINQEAARTELDTLMNSYVAQMLNVSSQPPPPLVTLAGIDEGNATQRQQMVSVALLLSGIVGAVLLIGCGNVANLLLSQATARRRELAVRLAIGASRARIVRQLLVESLLLSLIGGAAGVCLAWVIMQAFQAAPPPGGALPAIDLALNQRVLWFSLALSMAAGLAFGLAPALKASRPNVVPALKDVAVGDKTGRKFGVTNVLVGAEVALSLLLLIAAGLFVRSLQAAERIELGFDADKLVSAPLNINLLRYTTTQGREFYRRLVERLEQLPGVERATVARVALLTGGARVLSFHIEGRQATHDRMMSEGGAVARGETNINANVVGPQFFTTLGIPLALGRDFMDQDRPDGPLVTIVNETTVAMHFAGENPIGKRVSFGGPQGPWREIVGVARDSKYSAVAEAALPVAYLPLAQNHETGMTLYVRTFKSPASLVAGIRREIQALEPNLPVPTLQTMQETVGSALYPARMGAWLLSVFGGLAILLAAVGIYGVLSFATARRTREMGIRLALGAERRDVFMLVLRDGMALVIMGVVIGLAAALLGSQSLSRFLYGVATSDMATFVLATGMVLVVALVACAIPARRAMRVPPVVALRYE